MTPEEDTSFYEFSHFRLNVAGRRLMDNRNQSLVPLSPKSFDLLLLLVRNENSLVTKEMIFSRIWDERFVEENNLTVRVSELRKALGEKSGGEKYIETVSGSGYRFIAKVRKVYNSTSKSENNDEIFSSLAVLPFINETNDQSLEYLCDGITESVINNLSQLPGIRVIARNTVFRYKNQEFELQSIGQTLSVTAVLIGRIYEFSDKLMLSVELVNVSDQTQIWGASYNYRLSDTLILQEEVAKEVSERLKITLTGDESVNLSKRYTQNSEAYLLYLKGRYFWNKRSIKEINKAIKYFELTIEKEPTFALAYAGLADCFCMLFSYGALTASNAIPKAEAEVNKALEIDNFLAEPHTSLAWIRTFYNRNLAEAEKEFKRSIELNFNYAPAHYWYASHLIIMERFDEALFEIKQAQQIDPLSLINNRAEGRILYFSRQYDKAISKCLETLELDPNFAPVRGILGQAYLGKQMYKEALQEFKKSVKLTAKSYELPKFEDKQFSAFQKKIFSSESDPDAIAAIGYIYAITNKRDKAFEIIKGLEYLYKCMYIEPHLIALIYMGLGDLDQAFEWLEKSFSNQSLLFFSYLKVWPLFDGFRSDPRFEDLLRRIDLKS
jgi:TolB-like protein